MNARNMFRRGGRFVPDHREFSLPLDQKRRASIIFAAEALERRTKRPGSRSGVLGLTGLAVLRCLAFSFLNRSSGLCCPSVRAIQEKTGLARSAIFEALNRLEAAGIIERLRRLGRRVVTICGMARLTTVQSSNLYRFSEPNETAHLLPVGKPRPNRIAKLLAGLVGSFSFGAGSAKRPDNHSRGYPVEEDRAGQGISGLAMA